MLSQPPPEAQQHPCTQPRNPSCSHSAPVSHLACSHARSLICAGIRAETFLPPTCQLTRFTSPTCLSPPSLTKAGASPQASGHFFHPSLAYCWSLLPATNQGPDLPSKFLTAMYFRGAHKHPHSPRHPLSLTHEGQQFISANHRAYEASLEGTSWTLAGLRWRWMLSLEWRTGSPRNKALGMKPQPLRNQQTGGLNGKTWDSKCATWHTASHTHPQKCDHLRITWSNYELLHSWTDNVPPPGHGLSSIAAESPQQRNSELRQTAALL